MSFDRPTRKIRPIQKGQRITARKLAEPVEAINRFTSGIAPIAQLAGSSSKPLSITIARFVITSISGDYLVCREFDGTAQGTADVYISKPYLLRSSMASRAGVTFTYTDSQARSATDGSTTEDQSVTPSYVAGDEIYAVRGLVRGSGAFSDPDETRAIEWMDLNLDARAWAQTEE